MGLDAAFGCMGVAWAAFSCMGVAWAAFGCLGLANATFACVGMADAAFDCMGVANATFGCLELTGKDVFPPFDLLLLAVRVDEDVGAAGVVRERAEEFSGIGCFFVPAASSEKKHGQGFPLLK